jgi:hypothetical protein
LSFLTPLYVLGALAVVGPILFHLIRRRPRGEVPFSSLMFLSPSPPRLTRRSRPDDLLLLLLRASALCLLALAFARPFLRRALSLDREDAAVRRVAVLLDTSASMRRGGLWRQALAEADKVIAECRPGDQVAVYRFDATTRPVLTFAESVALDPARRQAVARARLGGLSPSWGSTRLGQALTEAVGAVNDEADATERNGRMPRRVVLVSDLQQGARLDELGDFEWPKDVELELRTLREASPNAGLQWLDGATDAEPAGAGDLRVRVWNEADSRRDRFELDWVDGRGRSAGSPVPVYVPAGESRVVRLRRPSGSAAPQRLRLKGDAVEFDNTLYLAAGKPDEATVFYLGNDTAANPDGLRYYLERALPAAAGGVRFEAQPPAEPLTIAAGRRVPLVVLAAETTRENAARLRDYARGGGTVLAVLAAPGRAETLAAITEVPAWEVEETALRGDALLGEIAFNHPLFAPFAGPQFNDFTKFRFWKHRRLDPASLGGAHVLARFENGDAAVVEKPVGKGRVVVLASGWNPADSQLARSSKFVPFLTALLELGDPRPPGAGRYVVGDRVRLPGVPESRTVRKPDGTAVTLEPGATSFDGTDQPGVYTIEAAGAAHSFAVNLDPAEGRTAPLNVETLEQLGCRLAGRGAAPADQERRRQLHNAELEGRQKLWRWLVVATIGVLTLETWLAGRRAAYRPARGEALPT